MSYTIRVNMMEIHEELYAEIFVQEIYPKQPMKSADNQTVVNDEDSADISGLINNDDLTDVDTEPYL